MRAPRLGGRARDVARAVAVDRGRGGLGRLGAVDVGPRGAVDHRARLGRRDDAAHVVGIGDVELGAGEGDDVVPQPGGGGGDGLPEHARASGDQQAHRGIFAHRGPGGRSHWPFRLDARCSSPACRWRSNGRSRRRTGRWASTARCASSPGPRTDLFARSRGRPARSSARRGSSARVEGDFQLSARVSADLQATFDAGALVLHAGDHTLGQARARALPAGRGDDRLGRHPRPVGRRQRPRGDRRRRLAARVAHRRRVRAARLRRRRALGARAPLRASTRPTAWPRASWPSRPPARAARRRSTTCASWPSRWRTCATAPSADDSRRGRRGLALTQLRARLGQLLCLQDQPDLAVGGRTVHGLPGGRQRHEVAAVGQPT